MLTYGHTQACTQMFTVLLIRAKHGNNPVIHQGRLNFKNVIYPYKEHDSEIKGSKTAIHVTVQLNLKTLCEAKEVNHKRPHVLWFH